MTQASAQKASKSAGRRRSLLVAAAVGLLLSLSSCIDYECPHEFARPLDRARYCGPSAP